MAGVKGFYYDRKGKELTSLAEWGRLSEDLKYKILKQTRIFGWLCSTVWLGLNHNFDLVGPPLIFETMIFKPNSHTRGSKNFGDDQYQDRYATETQAFIGHRAAVWIMCVMIFCDPFKRFWEVAKYAWKHPEKVWEDDE